MSRETVGYHNCHGATCIQWVETKDAAKVLKCRGPHPVTKNYQKQNVYNVMVKVLMFLEEMQLYMQDPHLGTLLLCKIMAFQVFQLQRSQEYILLFFNIVQTFKYFVGRVTLSQINLCFFF